jgi:putative methionine-R-sulfoxide reductase with GAF domain
MVVPIQDSTGAVVGLIDVESELVNAFSERDRQALEQNARAVTI